MSIEIWQFPGAANGDELVLFLKQLGYVTGENLFWPGPPGTVGLFWSEPADFKSTSGVDASVFAVDSGGKRAWNTTSDWGLRTRTSIWATSFDQDFQNQTVRRARKAFGGTFYNDHFGRNRYNVINWRKSTPVSRGIYAVFTRLSGELDSLEHALPPDAGFVLMTPKGPITKEDDRSGIFHLTERFDPKRVLYNALIPFLVATLEHFFRESFEILLTSDAAALRKLEGQNRKLSLTEAIAIARGDLTIERVVSGWYSFQNLDSIHKAFHEVHDINVLKHLRRRRKTGNRLPILQEAFRGLIEARHGVVHHFSIDRDLDRNGFLNLLQLTRILLQSAAKEIEATLGVPLGPG